MQVTNVLNILKTCLQRFNSKQTSNVILVILALLGGIASNIYWDLENS